jgi:hypothetical protein
MQLFRYYRGCEELQLHILHHCELSLPLWTQILHRIWDDADVMRSVGDHRVDAKKRSFNKIPLLHLP